MNLIEEYLSNYSTLTEYKYYKLPTSKFTFQMHKDPVRRNKFLDNGECEVCGKLHTYTLIDPEKPRMCYDCYQTVRAYNQLTKDVLSLKSKRILDVDDCKRIVKYMRAFTKQKALALSVLGITLYNTIAKDRDKKLF